MNISGQDVLITQRTDCVSTSEQLQKEHGGRLIWVQPLQTNGAYNFDRLAHQINYINGHYIDTRAQRIFDTKQQVRQWYKELYGVDSEIFNRNEVPFPISS